MNGRNHLASEAKILFSEAFDVSFFSFFFFTQPVVHGKALKSR
jgi:hypothetical protein